MRRRWTPQLAGEAPWQRLRGRVRRMLHRTRTTARNDPGYVTELVDDVVVVAVIVTVVLAVVVFVVPLLELLIDVVVLAVVTVVGIAGRVLFRRPWTIEVLSPEGARHTCKVVGWRASSAHRDALASGIAAGSGLPTADPNPVLGGAADAGDPGERGARRRRLRR